MYREEAHWAKGLKALLLLLSFTMVWGMGLAHLIPLSGWRSNDTQGLLLVERPRGKVLRKHFALMSQFS